MDTYKEVAEVNLWGTIRTTKAFLPLIRRAKGELCPEPEGRQRAQGWARAGAGGQGEGPTKSPGGRGSGHCSCATEAWLGREEQAWGPRGCPTPHPHRQEGQGPAASFLTLVVAMAAATLPSHALLPPELRWWQLTALLPVAGRVCRLTSPWRGSWSLAAAPLG